MVLHTECRMLQMSDTRNRIVIQVAMGDLEGFREVFIGNSETMVLSGDLNLFGFQVQDGMIGAAVSKLHFESLGT